MEEGEELILGAINYVHNQFKEAGYPDDAAYVAMREMYGGIMGSTEAELIISIKLKYPQYWPWETKYYSIPKEVHDAYGKEIGDIFMKQLEDFQNSNAELGIMASSPPSVEYKEVTLKDFQDFFTDMGKNEERQKKEAAARRIKDKALWDKHYKPYGLKYRY